MKGKTMTQPQPQQKTGIDALFELEKEAHQFVKNCEAAGFHGITIVEMIKTAMDFLHLEALRQAEDRKDLAPKFNTREAAIAFAEMKKNSGAA
jgi:hypothetical protein